jgi:HAD superfamily hydrolase (TIGR01490 family)
MRAAAFYDMDGTLVSTNLVHSFLFLAMNEPSIPTSVVKTLSGIAKIPAFAVVDQFSRSAFNEMLFSSLKGVFMDNLLELADEHFEKVLEPALFPGAVELVQSGKKRGLRQVVVSGSLDFLVAPLARHLGIEDVIANRLEVDAGVATGRLKRPIVASAAKARFIQEFARDHAIDLLESYAFSDSYSDYAMLAVVGRPAAVNPDRRLRRAAREMRWPVMNLG